MTSFSFGQDLIITNRNDTVPCKILKKTAKYFNIQYENNGVVKDTSLRYWQVKEFKRDYLAPPKPNLTFLNYSFKGNTVFIPEFGPGYLTSKPIGSAKRNNSFQIAELQVGWIKGATVRHFVNNYLAIGATFNQLTTKNPRTHFINFGKDQYLILKDELKRTFIGASVQFRTISKDSLRTCSFIIDIGHMSEVNNFLFQEAGTYKHQAIGVNTGIEFTQFIHKRIGFTAKFYYSFLSNQHTPTLEGPTADQKMEYGGFMHYNHLALTFGVNLLLNKPKTKE